MKRFLNIINYKFDMLESKVQTTINIVFWIVCVILLNVFEPLWLGLVAGLTPLVVVYAIRKMYFDGRFYP